MVCLRQNNPFTCTIPHIVITLQKTFKDMRKFSILLLLISLPLMAMEVNAPSKLRRKNIDLQRWHTQQRTIVPIPIEAILDENFIEIRFLEKVDEQVIFQVKDQQENIIFQNIVITPSEQEIHKIDLNSIKAGHYKLLYIEEDITFIGEFEIE